MEKVVNNIRVYDKNCIGAKRFKKDVMLSVFVDNEFHDFFMDEETLRNLINEGQKVIKSNQESLSDE